MVDVQRGLREVFHGAVPGSQRVRHERARTRRACRARVRCDEMSLRELLGIELPILQAPMAGAQDSALAIAVSNAGGLGALPCALLTLDQLRDELSRLRAQTVRPFNVNFFCHAVPAPDAARETRWR